jgi:hypothetical protein
MDPSSSRPPSVLPRMRVPRRTHARPQTHRARISALVQCELPEIGDNGGYRDAGRGQGTSVESLSAPRLQDETLTCALSSQL